LFCCILSAYPEGDAVVGRARTFCTSFAHEVVTW
jgi:hypothetical protein